VGVPTALQDPLVHGARQRLGHGVHLDSDFVPRLDGCGIIHQDLRKFFDARIRHRFGFQEKDLTTDFRKCFFIREIGEIL
jgi:hypothetical protein